jgi:ADP-L-glycero-D-manno-heptose 6-epimerase
MSVVILAQKYEMIVITGAAGFIGSVLISYLNEVGIYDAVPVDDFSPAIKMQNLAWKHHATPLSRDAFFSWMETHQEAISAIVHLGGKAGYFHEGWEQHRREFLEQSQSLWNFCTKHRLPFLYASSGAVYGMGESGFSDAHDVSLQLKAVHPYTQMRLDFDNWAIQQDSAPPFWAGLRMFNVYGPNEYHKGNNASIILKAYNEILLSGEKKLYASHRPEYVDGGMSRDFIYVKDIAAIIQFLLTQRPESGLYNVGTGEAHTFLELTKLIFKAMDQPEHIGFEPIPEGLRSAFPYFSKADISKLKLAGYTAPLRTIAAGTEEYIHKYLRRGAFY